MGFIVAFLLKTEQSLDFAVNIVAYSRPDSRIIEFIENGIHLTFSSPKEIPQTIASSINQTVYAPQPAWILPASLPPNRVISVELNSDEDVDWTWISLPDGTRYIGGYSIVKKTD